MPSTASSSGPRLGASATLVWSSTASRFRRASLASPATVVCPSIPWCAANAVVARSTRVRVAPPRRPTTPHVAAATYGRVRSPSTCLAVGPTVVALAGSCVGLTISLVLCRGCRRTMLGLVDRCRTFIVRRLAAFGHCPTCRGPRFSPITTSMAACPALVASTCPGTSIGTMAYARLMPAATATRGTPAPGP